MQNLYKDYAQVIHNAELGCLEVIFTGFITFDELKEVIDYEFKMFTHFKLKKCVVNLRDITVYPQGGQEYIKNIWFPWIVAHGVKAIAIVVPDDVFAQMSMQEAHSADAKPVTTKYFQKYTEALAWIRAEEVVIR
jgi:hypothetical protein